MSRKYFGVIIILTVAIFLYNLYFDNKRSFIKNYGKDFNDVRQLLNIPKLPNNWKIVREGEQWVIWSKNKFLSDTIPHHYHKKITFNNDSIYLEKDDFHYETNSDKAYRISVFYNYTDSSRRYEFIKYFKGAYPPTVSYNVDKTFADSLFTAWGLEHYY